MIVRVAGLEQMVPLLHLPMVQPKALEHGYPVIHVDLFVHNFFIPVFAMAWPLRENAKL